jgi:hypothetical protein
VESSFETRERAATTSRRAAPASSSRPSTKITAGLRAENPAAAPSVAWSGPATSDA